MAKTTAVEVLQVSTLKAVESVTDLKNNISELKRVINGWTETTKKEGKDVKEVFEGLKIGTDQYKQAVKQLEENQAALRNAMHGTAATIDQVKDAAAGLDAEQVKVDASTGKLVQSTELENTSYNSLVRTMAKLQEEWRSTTDAQTRANLGEKINAVNTRLKELDGTIGNHKRNVGNYIGAVEHLGDIMRGMQGVMPGVARGIGGVTTGLKAMSATPAIFVVSTICQLLSKLIEGLKSSEEGMESVTAAMGIFSGIGDTITSIVQGLAEGLGWLAKQFVNLLEKLNLVNDKMKARQEIAQEEIRIAKMQRDATMQNAEAERDIAELRAKAVDKEKYSAKERIKFLEDANKKQEEISKRARDAAKAEYDLIVKKNAQTKTSTEGLQAEADAYAKMVKADTDYQNALRQNARETQRVKKELAAEERQRRKDTEAAQKEALEAQKTYMEQELRLLAEGSQERLDKQLEIREKELEIAIASAKGKITNKEELNKQLLLLEQIYEADVLKMQRDFEQAQVDQAIKAQQNKVAALTKGTAEAMQETIALRQMELDTLAQMDGESEAEFEARRIAAYNALKDARLEYATWQEEQTQLEWENWANSYQEGSMQALAAQVVLKQAELDTLHQLEGESNAEFRARELAAEKAFYDAKKKQRDAWMQQMAAVASGVSGILGSIADMYESNTEKTEEEAKKAKNLRIAAATIDMLQGAVTAYAGAQTLGVPMGPIVGAINAAAVVAAGIANIAKIKATDVSANAGNTSTTATIPAAVEAPSVEPQVTETRTITSASEEDRLNRMADEHRVYILSSDLEADRQQTQVRVAETTF